MDYKVVWTNGASVRPQPNTGGSASRVLSYGQIVAMSQDQIPDSSDPTDVNKRWAKLADGSGYVATDYPDSMNTPRQRMALVTVTPPPSGDAQITGATVIVHYDSGAPDQTIEMVVK